MDLDLAQLLPLYEAVLNGCAFVLMVIALISIKSGNKSLHKAFMIGAIACSAGFLVLYLYYHYNFESVRYVGPYRPFYLAILITHIPLAAFVPVLVGLTVWRAIKEQWASHRRLAKFTVPIWSYVSITGILIYLMLRTDLFA